MTSQRHVTTDERLIHFPTMTVEDFNPNDLAHALSNICRYNGLIKHFFSVAQHSVMACELAEAEYGVGSEEAKLALLHDAAEAYIGDISTPLKIHLPDYAKLEHHIEGVIKRALSLTDDTETWQRAMRFDRMCFRIETTFLMMHDYDWIDPAPKALVAKSRAAMALANGSVWNPPRAKMEMEKKLRQYGITERLPMSISQDPKHTNPNL